MGKINIPENLAIDKNFVPQDGAVYQPQDNTEATKTLNFMHKRDKTHVLIKINKSEFYSDI